MQGRQASRFEPRYFEISERQFLCSNNKMLSTGIMRRAVGQSIEKENHQAAEEARLNELRKRFNSLGVSVDKTKKARVEVVEEAIGRVDQMVAEIQEDQTVGRLRKTLGDIHTGLEEGSFDGENFENEFKKRLGQVSEEFRSNLDDLRADNRALVSEFSKQGTDRLFAISLNLDKSQKAFQEQLDALTLKIGESIDGMRDQIERENQEREESAEAIEIKVMAELDGLEEELLIERKLKEETNSKIKALIDEMHLELSRRIEQEKREREQSNDSLLNLLDEACNRIERSFANLL